MKNINQIIASLNVARSNDCSKEKSEEFKSIIKELLPYGDLEQELGIDLLTLFKALKNGIYTRIGKEIEFIPPIRLYIDRNNIYEIMSNKLITHDYLKGYGKTWALTKEELL